MTYSYSRTSFGSVRQGRHRLVLSAFPLASLELDLLGNLGRWNAPAVLADVQPCHPHLLGHATTGSRTGEIEIRVSAREGSKLVGSDTFKLTITPRQRRSDRRARLSPISRSRKTPLVVPGSGRHIHRCGQQQPDLYGYARHWSGAAELAHLQCRHPHFHRQAAQDFNGSMELKVTASDGSLSTSDTFNLTVNAVNDSPVVAAPIADQSMAEDANLVISGSSRRVHGCGQRQPDLHGHLGGRFSAAVLAYLQRALPAHSPARRRRTFSVPTT